MAATEAVSNAGKKGLSLVWNTAKWTAQRPFRKSTYVFGALAGVSVVGLAALAPTAITAKTAAALAAADGGATAGKLVTSLFGQAVEGAPVALDVVKSVASTIPGAFETAQQAALNAA